MAAGPGRQLPTNSFHVIRTPIAVLPVAPFSPDRELKYCSRQRPAKAQWGSMVPPRGAEFGSPEPTSPEVGCMGQIKLKQKWTKVSVLSVEKSPGRTTQGNLLSKIMKGNLPSKIMKFIFGSHAGGGQGDSVAACAGDCPTQEGCRSPYPLLGQLKRYASTSYDAKFGDIYPRPHLFVDPSGSPHNESNGGRG